MLSLLALALVVASAAPTHLTIEPWTGKDLVPTATTTAKFRLVVNGKPNATLHLQATEVADGWLGAFCTPNVCSPQRVDVTLPKSGHAVYQFELIREEDNAPAKSGARVVSDDGAFVEVPAASR